MTRMAAHKNGPDAQGEERDRLPTLETWYKGIKYRTRTEGRVAVFIDGMGPPPAYDYEVNGYNLDGLWYCPDMFLIAPLDSHYWVEVKGWVKDEQRPEVDEKARRLAVASGVPVVVCTGRPTLQSWTVYRPDGRIERCRPCKCPYCPAWGWATRGIKELKHSPGCPGQGERSWGDEDWVQTALRKVADARFQT